MSITRRILPALTVVAALALTGCSGGGSDKGAAETKAEVSNRATATAAESGNPSLSDEEAAEAEQQGENFEAATKTIEAVFPEVECGDMKIDSDSTGMLLFSACTMEESGNVMLTVIGSTDNDGTLQNISGSIPEGSSSKIINETIVVADDRLLSMLN